MQQLAFMMALVRHNLGRLAALFPKTGQKQGIARRRHRRLPEVPYL
ncbi:hypothetical protein [Rufibacter immobilis]|nr:hypothetical protein [Rufibacter immobilis]